METKRLTQELIPEVTRGGNDALVHELELAFAKAEERDEVVIVHYEDRWLQWVVVAMADLDLPETKERLNSDSWWNKSRIRMMLPSSEERGG